METNITNQQPQLNSSSPQVQPSLNPIPNQNGNFLIPIGVIFLILIVGTGAYYLGIKKGQTSVQNYQPTQQVSTSPTSPIATAQPSNLNSTQNQNIPADWKLYTSINGDFTMKYPVTFYTSKIAVYAGGGNEIYLTDSQATISKWQQNTILSNQNILIQPIELSFGEVGDATGHTKDEILEKIANRLGTSKLVDGSVNVPWVNENGGTYDGKKYYYSANFIKLMINGKLAARVTTSENIAYLIMRDDSYVRISASPANSVFISDFDKIISTFTFNK